MKPFLKYPGGKSKEIPLVRKYMPLNVNRYFEPFVGGGAIYFELDCNKNYINDFSDDLIFLYNLVKNQNEDLKQLLLEMDNIWGVIEKFNISENVFNQYSWIDFNLLNKFYLQSVNNKSKTVQRIKNSGNDISEKNIFEIMVTAKKTAFYMLVRFLYNNSSKKSIMHAASYYFLREYCYSSMFRFSKNGDFNVPYGGLSYNYKRMKNKIEYMFSEEMKNKMDKTIVCNYDFEKFIHLFNFDENDFIFLDPPYDTEFSTYDQNVFDKNEQIRLSECLHLLKAKWMLIIKKTDFIYDLYKDFNIYEYDVNYMVSFKNRNDRDVKHLLITNYDLAEE